MNDDMTIEMLTKVIARLEEINQGMDEFNHRFSELEKRLGITREIGSRKDVAESFNWSISTIRRREKTEWIKGVHYWYDNNRPVYNLVLLRDGQINGFQSSAHQRAIEQWRQALPSSQKRKRRA